MTRRSIPFEERKQLMNIYLEVPYYRWVQKQAQSRNIAQTALIREIIAAHVEALGGLGDQNG